MRKNILELISKTIIHKYDLPNENLKLARTIYSLESDKCFAAQDSNSFAEIIYNSILEYSFNEFDIEGKDFNDLHAAAFRTKLKYNPEATESQKLKYGFFGEVIFFALLCAIFNVKPVIARGYLFNPLENTETKGYDSYHLLEVADEIQLWFGEVKFHESYKSGVNDVFKNIDKAISDNYLGTNFLAMTNHVNNLNTRDSKIEKFLEDIAYDPIITIVDKLKKYNMKLVYPVMVLYNQDDVGYDSSIGKVTKYIEEKHSGLNFTIGIDYSIFFILLPLDNVKKIKSEVLKWIDSKKQLMS